MRVGWVTLLIALLTGCKDVDGDGLSGGRDCDDNDPRAFVGAAEACDGIDNDCNGQVDEEVAFVAWQDRDGDGHGDPDRARRVCALPEDGVLVGDDCDDLDATAVPGGVEVCDGADNDCDGTPDEDVGETYFADADGDGHGLAGSTTQACSVPPGYARLSDECDDAQPLAWTAAEELCDGVDNDCDGAADEGLAQGLWPVDGDGDGHGHPTLRALACGPGGAGVAADPTDCDDDDASVHPGVPEATTPGSDDDCDGYVDEITVPTDQGTLEGAVALASPGDVVQLVGIVESDADLRGTGVILAGEGCERSTLLGSGAGTTLLADGGRIEGLTITGGQAGGVVISGDVQASRICVRQNVSPNFGGGIRVDQGTLTLSDSDVIGNQAEFDGGGIVVMEDAGLIGRRIRVIDNYAGGNAGGLNVRSGTADVAASVFAANVAFRDGGAVSMRKTDTSGSGGQGVFTNCTFVDNLTDYDLSFPGFDQSHGSAVRTEDVECALTLNNCLFAWQQGPDDVIDSINLGYVLSHGGFARNGGRDTMMGWRQDTVRGSPDFVLRDPAVPPERWDLRLMDRSAFIDAGDPSLTDPDGTRSDIGAHGGPEAAADHGAGYAADIDSDGMTDPWEAVHGLIVGLADGALDADGDGLVNADEQERRSDPLLPDSDGDGVDDGTEGAQGTRPDWSGDRLPLVAMEMPRQWVPGVPMALDGRASFDADAVGVDYLWTVDSPPGSSVTAPVSPTSAVTTLTPDVSGAWIVTLTVTSGGQSASYSLALDVRDALVVPDDVPDLEMALGLAGAAGSIALRPGTWQAGVTISGFEGAIFGLGLPGEVVLDGGGQRVIDVLAASDLELRQLTLTGGAAGTGAGISCVESDLTAVDVEIRGNVATAQGGGVYLRRCPATLDRVVVAENTALNGGGIYLTSGALTVLRSMIWHNVATGLGGGLRVDAAGVNQVNLFNLVFQGNSAPSGSAISYKGPADGDHMAAFRHLVVADHHGGSSVIRLESGLTAVFDSILFHNDATRIIDASLASPAWFGLVSWDNAGELFDDPADAPLDLYELQPGFLSWVDDGDPDNDVWTLRPGDPLNDLGSFDETDLDGGSTSIGLGGGEWARRAWLRDPRDVDGDGMADGWELRFGLDPSVPDAHVDGDGDGESNGDEYGAGTLPDRTDTDGDGVLDGQ